MEALDSLEVGPVQQGLSLESLEPLEPLESLEPLERPLERPLSQESLESLEPLERPASGREEKLPSTESLERAATGAAASCSPSLQPRGTRYPSCGRSHVLRGACAEHAPTHP